MFDGLISVYTAASGASLVQIFLDMMPAESAYLKYPMFEVPMELRMCFQYLIATDARFKVEIRDIHFF
jgi:hypothetical protein